MSDLNLGPAADRTPIKAILIAAVVVSALAYALYFAVWRKPEISVVRAAIFAPHTVFKQMPNAMHVVGAQTPAEDNVYVAATVRITDRVRSPIVYSAARATMLDSQGGALDATVVAARDLPRLEASFPDIAPMVSTPLADGDVIAPGTTREGTIMLLFSGLKQDEWKARRSATLTITFEHQAPMTVSIP